jgi:hypothetical protein
MMGGPLPPELAWERQGNFELYEAIWGSGPNDIYAVGRAGSLVHSVGDGTWQSQETNTSADLKGIWGSGSNDIYVATTANLILHSAGDGTWDHQAQDSGTSFNNVGGVDSANVYVVGAGVMHGTGDGMWGDSQKVASGTLYAVWGSSPTNLYVAMSGASGHVIYHSKGDGNWSAQTSPSLSSAHDVWGWSADHLYAAAENMLLRSTGDGTWASELNLPTPVTERFVAVFGPSPEAIYAPTDKGNVYRSNGAGTWSEPQVVDPTRQGMSCFDVWASSPTDVYLACQFGVYHGVPK